MTFTSVIASSNGSTVLFGSPQREFPHHEAAKRTKLLPTALSMACDALARGQDRPHSSRIADLLSRVNGSGPPRVVHVTQRALLASSPPPLSCSSSCETAAAAADSLEVRLASARARVEKAMAKARELCGSSPERGGQQKVSAQEAAVSRAYREAVRGDVDDLDRTIAEQEAELRALSPAPVPPAVRTPVKRALASVSSPRPAPGTGEVLLMEAGAAGCFMSKTGPMAQEKENVVPPAATTSSAELWSHREGGGPAASTPTRVACEVEAASGCGGFSEEGMAAGEKPQSSTSEQPSASREAGSIVGKEHSASAEGGSAAEEQASASEEQASASEEEGSASEEEGSPSDGACANAASGVRWALPDAPRKRHVTLLTADRVTWLMDHLRAEREARLRNEETVSKLTRLVLELGIRVGELEAKQSPKQCQARSSGSGD